MPIAKIVGIDIREYVKKETGELKTSTVVHYTYKLKGKGMEGQGADNVFFNTDKFDLPKLGGSYLIEKDKKGYLENFEPLEDVLEMVV